jgi:hypothetical protein
MRNFEEGLKYNNTAFEIRKKLLHADHPHIADSLDMIAESLEYQGLLENAM